MDSRSGKQRRLSRIIRPEDGRAVCIAYSHGVLLGPQPGLETLEEMRQRIGAFRAADAVMLAPGMVAQLSDMFVGRDAPGLIIEADWQNQSRTSKASPPRIGRTVPILAAEEALAAGADAIMTYLWMGGDDPEVEAMEVERNAAFARACERVGLPLIIESRGYPPESKADGTVDVELVKFHARVAAELGADLIKTKYTGSAETFAEVTSTCPVPVLALGSTRLPTVEEALDVVSGAVEGGAAGVLMGRNIFQVDDPAGMLAEVIARVHGRS